MHTFRETRFFTRKSHSGVSDCVFFICVVSIAVSLLRRICTSLSTRRRTLPMSLATTATYSGLKRIWSMEIGKTERTAMEVDIFPKRLLFLT